MVKNTKGRGKYTTLPVWECKLLDPMHEQHKEKKKLMMHGFVKCTCTVPIQFEKKKERLTHCFI